jgi:hypothetical protein
MPEPPRRSAASSPEPPSLNLHSNLLEVGRRRFFVRHGAHPVQVRVRSRNWSRPRWWSRPFRRPVAVYFVVTNLVTLLVT